MIEKECLLKKFPGKGGWTYIEVPEISPDKNVPFGWVTVSGSIDNYVFQKFKLQPKGNGMLFLPVKAEIRKAIKKGAGDHVLLKIQIDNSPAVLPAEIRECFENEPKIIFERFMALPENKKQAWIKSIYSTNSDDAKAVKIVEMMKSLHKP